jgi:hypothetical protein
MSAGLLVAFPNQDALVAALGKLRAAKLGAIETYTPKPLEEGHSPLPVLILLAGLGGTLAAFWLQSYAFVWAYPIDIGGRPPFSWPAFIPIAFEIGVLAAIATGFFGFLVINRMPTLYHPVDDVPAMRYAMRDLWCATIRTQEPDRVRELLRWHSPEAVQELPE